MLIYVTDTAAEISAKLQGYRKTLDINLIPWKFLWDLHEMYY